MEDHIKPDFNYSVERLTLEDSNLWELYYLTIPLVFLFIFIPISWLINPPESVFEDLFITLIIFLSLEILCLCMELHFRINEVKFILTKLTFKVIFKNEVFARIAWNDITKIQIIKESIDKSVFREEKRKVSYRLIFLGPSYEKILKLSMFPIRKKNIGPFLDSFKDYFKKMNKNIIE